MTMPHKFVEDIRGLILLGLEDFWDWELDYGDLFGYQNENIFFPGTHLRE